MFAYFRNREQHGHRRTGSTPTTPTSPPLQSPSYPPQWPDLPSAFSNSPASARPVSFNESPISPLPPVLPPIPRIASTANRPPRNDAVQGERSYSQARLPEPMRATVVGNAMAGTLRSQDDTGDTPKASRMNPKHASTIPTSRMDLKWAPNFKSLHLDPLDRPHPSGRRQPGQTVSAATQHQDVPHMPHNEASRLPHSASFYSESQRGSASPWFPEHVYRSASPSSSAYTLLPKAASSTNLSSAENLSGSSKLHQTTSQTAQPPSKPSKSKLNLLNPVSLLMRRRSSQITPDSTDGPLPIPRGMDFHVNRLTDSDYKPIKGNIVHDFNAPRNKRFPSNSEADDIPEPTSASSGDLSDTTPNDLVQPSLPEKSHFVEDFSDSTDDKANASAIQRESLANQAFLARASRQLETEKLETPPPSRTPPAIPREAVTPKVNDRGSKETINTAYRESLDKSTVRSSLSRGTRDTSPGADSSRGPSPSIPDRRSADLPRHMASTASRTSRFSFQMHSESSREQEQALEEKHKKRMDTKHKQRESTADSRFDELEEEDMSAYDDIDMDGDDDIPYVGDDSFSGFSGAYSASGVSLGVSDFSLEQDPLPYQSQTTLNLSSFPQRPTINRYVESASQEVTPKAKQVVSTASPLRANTRNSKISDDMYFDDGDIDLVSASDRGTFDESVFDMSPNKAAYSLKSMKQSLPSHEEEDSTPSSARIQSARKTSNQDEPQTRVSQPEHTVSVVPSREPTGSSQHNPAGSASDKGNGQIHAYHKALASAATRAANDGKFSRNPSTIAGSSVYSDSPIERPGDDDIFGSTNVGFDDYDNDVDEDPLIAAANAEALSVDDAGFYGQEFGFYKSGGGEAFNGGYWGNPSDNRMIGNAIMEPNLTPITERSEFSNRNSFISLHAHSQSWDAAVAPSPGLREIAAGIEMDEDDMTLGQLMRLRKEAFAGAGASRKSFVFPSSGSSGNSPTGHHSYSPNYAAPSGLATYAADGNTYHYPNPDEGSADEEQSDEFGYDSPNSPTVSFAISGHRATPSISESQSPPALPQSGGESNLSSAASESARNSVRHSLRSSTSDVPIINPPRPPSLTKSAPAADLVPKSPPANESGPAISEKQAFSPASPPMPSSSVLQKFASRPSPDAYRQTSYQSPTSPPSANPVPQPRTKGRHDRDSVAYVQENANWYLERRRTTSTGEVIVVGRELVEGGRI